MKHADLIGRLRPEQPERKKEVLRARNLRLERLLQDFVGYQLSFQRYTEDYDTEPAYKKAAKIVTYPFGADDVQQFIIANPKPIEPLEEFEYNKRRGVFVSLLMNRCDQRKYSLFGLQEYDLIGAHFGKEGSRHVIIKGDVDTSCGEGMVGGKLEITGNASHYLGAYMKEGTIIVHGDGGTDVGHMSKGGIIKIKGTWDWGEECQAQVNDEEPYED